MSQKKSVRWWITYITLVYRRPEAGTQKKLPCALTLLWDDGEEKDAGELLLALGQRSADERIAYLFLHLIKRIKSRGVIRAQRYPFPLRQQDIAGITGVTPVHVSRVLGNLHRRGICRLSGGILEVADPAELERIGSVK